MIIPSQFSFQGGTHRPSANDDINETKIISLGQDLYHNVSFRSALIRAAQGSAEQPSRLPATSSDDSNLVARAITHCAAVTYYNLASNLDSGAIKATDKTDKALAATVSGAHEKISSPATIAADHGPQGKGTHTDENRLHVPMVHYTQDFGVLAHYFGGVPGRAYAAPTVKPGLNAGPAADQRFAFTFQADGQSLPVVVTVLPGRPSKIVIRSPFAATSGLDEDILQHVRGLLRQHGIEGAQIVMNGKQAGSEHAY